MVRRVGGGARHRGLRSRRLVPWSSWGVVCAMVSSPLASGCAQLLGFEDVYSREEGGSAGGDAGGPGSVGGATSSGGATASGGGAADGGSGGTDTADGGSGGTGSSGGVGSGGDGTGGGSGGGEPLVLDRIDAGTSHVCGVRPNGALQCWGGFYEDSRTPPPGTFTEVACGNEMSCALDGDGYVSCWGWPTPPSPPNEPFTALAVGGTDACGIREVDKGLTCWGSSTPTLPDGEFSEVAVGDGFGCALTLAGSAECWDLPGDIGTGSYTTLSAGVDHVCARVSGSGTVECWGSDTWEQSSPLTGAFDALAAGDGFTCGLRTNGAVGCWGYTSGDLEAIPSGSYAAVTAGSGYACVLSQEGVVTCWGDSGFGATTLPEP